MVSADIAGVAAADDSNINNVAERIIPTLLNLTETRLVSFGWDIRNRKFNCVIGVTAFLVGSIGFIHNISIT